ncbi:MAG: type 4a pilus biogenesis protein PilO [Gammaproteobacteria bacterium]|nr:type 4a pilus biogenesis protein PilO [Gammaproteobacteria bacterium]
MNFKQIAADLQAMDVNDLKRIGVAPNAVKGLVIFLAFVSISAAGAWFFVQPMNDRLKTTQVKEQELKTKFDTEQSKAANREAYTEQLAQMQKTFNVMLRQLPNKTDIESLLVDLSQTSVASGLDVEYFKPEHEVAREFYAEYPITISVTGNYHEFGSFVSGLSALPRIVTLGEIKIGEQKTQGGKAITGDGPKELTMDLVATTYRYLEDE